MKNLLIALCLALALPALAQEYKNRLPTPTEERKVAGLNHWLMDGPRFNVFNKFVGEGEILAVSITNNIMFLRSAAALSNCFVQMPNPTNYKRFVLEVACVGNVSATLSNASGTGPGFTTMTNLDSALYIVPTNTTVKVVSTGTNYFVIPGIK